MWGTFSRSSGILFPLLSSPPLLLSLIVLFCFVYFVYRTLLYLLSFAKPNCDQFFNNFCDGVLGDVGELGNWCGLVTVASRLTVADMKML